MEGKMDLNQSGSASGTNPIVGSQNSIDANSSPMSDQAAASSSPIQEGITFDDNLRADDNFANLQNVDLAVTNEMKLEKEIETDPIQVNSGIENGSSRFDTQTVKAVEPPVVPAPPTAQTDVQEISAPEAKVSVAALPKDEEPKGEILTSFVNNQNYSDVKKGLSESMSTETTKNETNSSLHDTSPVAPHSVVTPDPTKTNEAESHINPASFAMPASAEIHNAAPEEIAPKSAEQSFADPSSAVKNHVPLSEHYDHIASSPESAPATFIPEKKKASLKWLWITLGSIFGVLFVFAGLVTATETGMINWGFDKIYSKMGVQKIWKGLPFDSRGALLISATQMAKINQSHVVADMTVSVSVGADSSVHAYLHDKGGKFAADYPTDPTVATGGDIEMTSGDSTAIADSTQVLPTFDNFTVNLKLDTHANATKSDSTFTIQSDVLPTYMSLINLKPEEGNKITSEAKLTDGKWYSRMPLLNQILGADASKWIKTDMSDLEESGLTTVESSSIDIKKEIESYSSVIKSGTRTGVETIDGVKTNKYHFVVDMLAIAKLSGEDESNIDDSYKNANVSADVWVGQKDKFIRKVVINASGTTDGTTVSLATTVTISDINKDFEVVAPADNEVETKTMNELIENITNKFYGDSSSGDTAATQNLSLSPSAADPKTWVAKTCGYAANSSFTIKLPTNFIKSDGSDLEDCNFHQEDNIGLNIIATLLAPPAVPSYDEIVQQYTTSTSAGEKSGSIISLNSPSTTKISGLLATDIPYFYKSMGNQFSSGIVETFVKVPKGTLFFHTEISGDPDQSYITSEFAGIQEALRKSIFDTIVIK